MCVTDVTVSAITRIRTETASEIVRKQEFDLLVDETPSKARDVAARAARYGLSHHDGLGMELRLIAAENGERWVEARDVESPASFVRKVDGRLRLTILPAGSRGSTARSSKRVRRAATGRTCIPRRLMSLTTVLTFPSSTSSGGSGQGRSAHARWFCVRPTDSAGCCARHSTVRTRRSRYSRSYLLGLRR
jgi:hypothetical protein